MKNIGIYVHIPFCVHKCDYCDFISYENKQDKIGEYVSSLIKEIKEVSSLNNEDQQKGKDEGIIVKTIYIGGGTPSYLESKHIGDIIKTIKTSFRIDKNSEITIEVNPGTVTQEKLKDYAEFGINRISIGIQSTNNERLKEIGRIHTWEQAQNTYLIAQKYFSNKNIDLMIGLPGQDLEDVKESIKNVLELNPEHISIYSLIVEEGTKIGNKIERGIINLPKEVEERQMYWYVKQELEKNGYIHYEISNFAKPRFESRHNLDCWEQKEYIRIWSRCTFIYKWSKIFKHRGIGRIY